MSPDMSPLVPMASRPTAMPSSGLKKPGPMMTPKLVTSLAASELEKVHNSFKNARMAPVALQRFSGNRRADELLWHLAQVGDRRCGRLP